MQNLQISYDLFIKLVKYHLDEDVNKSELESEIETQLNKKIDAILARNYYAKYKNAPTLAEREKAKKEYIKLKGYEEP